MSTKNTSMDLSDSFEKLAKAQLCMELQKERNKLEREASSASVFSLTSNPLEMAMLASSVDLGKLENDIQNTYARALQTIDEEIDKLSSSF